MSGAGTPACRLVADGEPSPAVLRLFHFIEDSYGEIFHGNVAAAFLIDQKLILADTVLAGARSFVNFFVV